MPGSDISAVHATTADEVYVAPGGGSVSGIYRTRDGGETWEQLLDDTIREDFGRSSITFTSAGIGWCAGLRFPRDIYPGSPVDGVVFKTTDGGKWIRSENPVFRGPLQDIKFADDTNGWAMQYNDKIDRSYVYRTTDAGESWHLVYGARELDWTEWLYDSLIRARN